MRHLLILSTALPGGFAACSRPARLAADLVITRANVWTGNPLQPEAHAIAIVHQRRR